MPSSLVVGQILFIIHCSEEKRTPWQPTDVSVRWCLKKLLKDLGLGWVTFLSLRKQEFTLDGILL